MLTFCLRKFGLKKCFETFATGLTWSKPPFCEVSRCFFIHSHQVVSINANFLLEEIWVKKIFFDTFAAGLTWPTPPFWEVSWCFFIHWYQIVSINANFFVGRKLGEKKSNGLLFPGAWKSTAPALAQLTKKIYTRIPMTIQKSQWKFGRCPGVIDRH